MAIEMGNTSLASSMAVIVATDPDRLIWGMPPDQPSFGSSRDQMHIRPRGYLQLGF